MIFKNNLKLLSKNIGKFIARWIEEKNGFQSRSFYGESFSFSLLNAHEILTPKIKKNLINAIEIKDKSDPEYHWEFNNYALLDYFKQSHDEHIKKFIHPLRFKHTACTNWTLLRSCCRLKAEKDEKLAIAEARRVLTLHQKPSGFILDDKKVKSFQYHCFSAAMTLEIYEHTGDNYFKISFLKAVNFIRKFISHSGETLYIGRGQNQSFGYGALMYILSAAYALKKDPGILADISNVLSFLSVFCRKDGSFPLMLNRVEPDLPISPDVLHPNFAGWYPYNNYFDYLPFLGYFLNKAADCIDGQHLSGIKEAQRSYRDKNFIKIETKNYQGILSKPGGYWTNDAPVPIIFHQGKRLTPCYGGEQFQKSIYQLKGIPLPYCNVLKKSIRWKAVSFFKKNTLWVISPLGVMNRQFSFLTDRIEIRTATHSIFPFQHLYLFHEQIRQIAPQHLETDLLVIKSDTPLKKEEDQFSSDGRLKLFSADQRRHNLTLEIKLR